MSGHSKWAQIKHKKAVVDAKRGNLFSKLARAIAIAAKEGGADPATNAKLQQAVERARSFNLPTENIERALAKAVSQKGAGDLVSVIYEAYGPGGSALVIEGITDNKNRTAAE
ncbi:MAG: YebC/PmpR family DNA-binding transcriptional regulator, partial [Candidatus Sungbacteria bacterium]|nr:YebC/PmpR family DNA-binding transcriptional regulator [Candidatus Sungbacteria bacterium]